MSHFTERVPLPRPEHMNSGFNYPSANFMINLLGMPRSRLYHDCMSPTSARLKKLLVFGYDVGPFNVSGLRVAAERLKRIFERVHKDNPELYAAVGTAGMLCCRKIRGGSAPSNHSWGAAIDLKINGQLDDRGDGHCQRGLLLLYPYFHAEGFFWGAEYRGAYEDAMHFELARETLQELYG